MKRRYAKIFEILIYVYAVNFLTGIVFQLVGVCDFASYMFFTKILIMVGLLLLCLIMYLAADTYADKSIYSNFWANVILTGLSGRCPADRIVCICGAVDDFYRENGDSGNECGA